MSNEYGYPFDAQTSVDSLTGSKTYDRAYASEDMASYMRKFIGNGVYASVGNGMQAYANGTDMFVRVKTGACFINGRAREWEYETELRLANADASNNRYDLVVARLDLSRSLIELAVIQGTPSVNPQMPSITQSETVFELALAKVLVKTGVTVIKQEDITDMRTSEQCGLVTGLLDQIDATSFFEQYETAYRQYLEELHGILDDETATNLLQKIETNTTAISKNEGDISDVQADLASTASKLGQWFHGTLSVDGWTDKTSYKEQKITVAGMTEDTQIGHVMCMGSASATTNKTLFENLNLLAYSVFASHDGYVYCACGGDLPTCDLDLYWWGVNL